MFHLLEKRLSVSETPGAQERLQSRRKQIRKGKKYKEKSPTQVSQVQKVLQEPGTTVHDPLSYSQN